MKRGFSLIEILVVIAVFAIIGVVASQAVITTLRGARKTNTETKVRQNIDYAMGIIQRKLYNAHDVTCPTATPNRIDFIDQNGTARWIGKVTAGTDQYIAQSDNDDRLTSTEVSVTQFVVSCTPGVGSSPATIDIMVTATDPLVTGPEGATITTNNKVVLRTSK